MNNHESRWIRNTPSVFRRSTSTRPFEEYFGASRRRFNIHRGSGSSMAVNSRVTSRKVWLLCGKLNPRILGTLENSDFLESATIRVRNVNMYRRRVGCLRDLLNTLPSRRIDSLEYRLHVPSFPGRKATASNVGRRWNSGLEQVKNTQSKTLPTVNPVPVMHLGGPMERYENLVRTGRLREDSHQKGSPP
jgi:hypothetical protein